MHIKEAYIITVTQYYMYSICTNNTCGCCCCWHIAHALNFGMQLRNKNSLFLRIVITKSQRKSMCERRLTLHPAAAITSHEQRWRHGRWKDDAVGWMRRHCAQLFDTAPVHTRTLYITCTDTALASAFYSYSNQLLSCTHLARSANLPEGLYILPMFFLYFLFFF